MYLYKSKNSQTTESLWKFYAANKNIEILEALTCGFLFLPWGGTLSVHFGGYEYKLSIIYNRNKVQLL